MNEARWTLRIQGRVQGVYYRASTQKAAAGLGLTGYALNLPDGGVEVVAEGHPDTLNQLYLWCLQGPPAARVDTVKKQEGLATGGVPQFLNSLINQPD